jgi:hypothetical protein
VDTFCVPTTQLLATNEEATATRPSD